MATQASSDAPRVLVVDDEAMLADLLSQALRHEGWETATAKDGLDALAKATSFQPDVVILDVQMPRMDGLETLERLRARGASPPLGSYRRGRGCLALSTRGRMRPRVVFERVPRGRGGRSARDLRRLPRCGPRVPLSVTHV